MDTLRLQGTSGMECTVQYKDVVVSSLQYLRGTQGASTSEALVLRDVRYENLSYL
jgi:hypothetical protein